MTEAGPSPHSRARAKRACLHCNRRRIRCNVLEMSPCHNCRSMNVPCEIGISRRGKYPRKKAQQRGDSTAPTIESGIPSSPGTPSAQSNLQDSSSRQRDSYTSPSTSQLSRLNTPGHTVFLGESSPLTAVIDEGHRSPHKGFPPGMQGTRLHYLVPERLDHNNSRDEALRAYKLKKEAQLQADGAFSFPPVEISQLLLQAYFKWFHPCFPILDRAEVHLAYENGNLSPFLLQAIHFIGVSLCTDAVFSRTKYETRYRAKFLFHSRARAIYDADWETDKIIKLQALFLLSFWRGGPSEERDTRFWLEVAISLAQKKGMHMMSKLSFQSSREERTWRRIWWALYIRDQQSAAALGLPPRIRDEDCDVAILSTDDLRDHGPIEDQHLPATQSAGYLHYPIEMAKLALRKIVSTQYIPMRSSADASSRARLRQELQEWEANLPGELRLERASTPDMTFLIGLLHMTYNNLYILLYRSLFLHPCDGLTDEGNIALEAATRSTRIIEDMLSHNLVQHGPTHLITHAFSTLCIQTIHCRRTTGTMRKLAEHRARLCLLGLQELQKSWDLENWVLNLFFRCLDDTTARTLRSDDALITKATGGTESQEHTDTDSTLNPEASETQVMRERPPNPVLVNSSLDVPESASIDLTATNEYYGLFNFTDDYTDVLGTYPSEADSLNLQNLEFLYRFL